jgi:ribose transport system substrate-binding protein
MPHAPASSGVLGICLARGRGLRLMVLLAFSLAVAACGPSPDVRGRLQIAVIPKGTQHEFWKSIHAGALQAAARLDVDIRYQGPDPEGDRQQQIQLLQRLVGSGVQGIVLAPIDERALAGVVDDAARQGVPTVVIDSALDGDHHVAFIATDNRQGGALAGERLVELLGGKGRIVMLRFQQGSASTTAREEGFLSVVQSFVDRGDMQILSDNQYAGDVEKARQTAESLLVAHPEIDGIFCPNESTTHGFLLALEATGKAGKVQFVGFDSSAPLLDGLERGVLHGLVLQDPVAMAAQGVEAIVAHLRGGDVSVRQNTDLVLATPENMREPHVAGLLSPDISILEGGR